MGNSRQQQLKIKQKRKEQLRKLYTKKRQLEVKITRVDERIYKIKQQHGATERTVILSVHFSCRFSDNVWEEPNPIIHTDTSFAPNGFKLKSLTVWKDFITDSPGIKTTITELCDSKCNAVNAGGMMEEILDMEVIDYYEE